MVKMIGEIMKFLPLRYPYLLIDRVIEFTEERVTALKNVTIGEPFFQGHFPEPLPSLMPGTLILEAMAQTAAILITKEKTPGYLVGVDKARFKQRVIPGDQLILQARALRKKDSLLKAEVFAFVNDKIVATAIVTVMRNKEPNE
ncbi:3-hydroxyacyl-ACP dehydratase FabZ [Candidatus Acetothermia bacterium]|jgi:3-hydroxyacyl-[acyl-carrier-protein] dehydratase|nr:3-hydroxyacyl-ACP dehydratase FabZ [Candidatus Acetothermia bacterium]MCI2427145.1 3-hydroxyacyl-ACP dehydratase FabZ [Candidatus Acetothermia bacterium]MCI2428667.1 3-hydroxyacyl-ACP dehydratase FabZ [Candidatus Acetothermia bacterium]